MSLSLESIRKENPWNGLAQKAPFVLRADAYHIDEYNRNRRTKPDHQIRTDIPPRPFVGSPANLRVVLLNTNPPWNEADVDDYAAYPEYAKEMRQNLTFENAEFPFYVINPAYENTAAYQWWQPRLAELIEACDERTDGCGRECVAQGLCAISFFPYYANEYAGEITELRCQKFAREMVRQFRDDDIPVVVTAHAAIWVKALPRLKDRFYTAATRQSGFITRKNLTKGAFDIIVDALTRRDSPAEAAEEPVEAEELEAIAA